MTSRSKGAPDAPGLDLSPSPVPAGEGTPAEALAALDDALKGSTGEPDQSPGETTGGGGDDPSAPPPKPKRGRPTKGSKTRTRREPAPSAPPPEPVTPAVLDAYASTAGMLIASAFRLLGRFQGGRPETWEVSEQERAEFGRACAPALALHHDTIGQYAPYLAPVGMAYEMWQRRASQAKREVEAERQRLASEPQWIKDQIKAEEEAEVMP